MTKQQHAIQAVENVVKLVLRDVPAEFAAVISQSTWDEHVVKTQISISDYLSTDHPFSSILTSSDICDKQGVVNSTVVIEALERMASLSKKRGAAPQLLHLAANMRHTFTNLGYIKTPKEIDGQES